MVEGLPIIILFIHVDRQLKKSTKKAIFCLFSSSLNLLKLKSVFI